MNVSLSGVEDWSIRTWGLQLRSAGQYFGSAQTDNASIPLSWTKVMDCKLSPGVLVQNIKY
ncbi:hypothetical protein [Flavobacterium sp. CFS9]|uniref:hypothetical protein n=1 Tax=Flavobacterium sp. CFS9 TaxID=3143118 RepID=UPI0034E8D81A